MDFFSVLKSTFRPTCDAFLTPKIPFTCRWRLLAMQPLVLLINSMKYLPWILFKAYTVHWIPTRTGHPIRTIVFQPPRPKSCTGLRPLHLDAHGGGFLGGIAEFDAVFGQVLAQRTGAVVVCTSYRAAPRHPFPAAIDDVDDVVTYLIENAERLFGADPKLFTVSGFSAGANLVLAAAQQPLCRPPAPTAIKASVTFCAPVDLRLPPWEKPKPPNYPKSDPLWWMLPLTDVYAGPTRPAEQSNPRLHPILAEANTLPEDMLFVIPAIDILVHEQLTFVERLKSDVASTAGGEARRIESMWFENGFHGWIQLPTFIVGKKDRTQAFDAACDFISAAHRKHGWNLKHD